MAALTRHTKTYTLLIAGIIAAGAIASIAAVSQSSRPAPSSPVPEIVILYEGREYSGDLRSYQWKGSVNQSFPNEHQHYDYLPINVANGSAIEFAVRNGSSPAYYAVSVTDTLMHPPLGHEDAAIVVDNARLDGNKLTVDFGKSNYFLMVAGRWITVDLSGQHEDTVVYSFVINGK